MHVHTMPVWPPRRWPLWLIWLLALAGCASTEPRQAAVADPAADAVAVLLAQAEAATADSEVELRLEAAELLFAQGRLDEAAQIAAQVNPGTPQAGIRLNLLRGRLELAANDSTAALARLREIPVPGGGADYYIDYYQFAGDIHSAMGRPRQAVAAWTEVTGLLDGDPGEAIRAKVWTALQTLSGRELEEIAASSTNYELRGWIELARVLNPDQHHIPLQLQSMRDWRRAWGQHSAARQFPEPLRQLQAAWDERPRHIALILPLREAAGAAIEQGFLAGYYEALAVSREVPRITLFDSSGATEIRPIYQRAVAAGADLVVGPLFKDLVNQLLEQEPLSIPVLALNYTDADPAPEADALFQFALAPEDEIDAIIDLAWSAGHRRAAAIYPANDVFLRLHNIFVERWLARGGSFVSRAGYLGGGDFTEVVEGVLDIDASEARLRRLLDVLPRSNAQFTPRRRRDIDFIFLMANPQVGRRIKPALDFYYAEDVPIFALPSIYDGSDSPELNRDLDGIVFADAPLMWRDMGVRLAGSGAERRLKAMGVDSFRLYPHLQLLNKRQDSSLRGATGELHMAESRRVHRRLMPGRFENGIAVPLAEPGG